MHSARALALLLPPLLLASAAATSGEGLGCEGSTSEDEVCLLQSGHRASIAAGAAVESSAQDGYGLDLHTWAGLDLPENYSRVSLLSSALGRPRPRWWRMRHFHPTFHQDPDPRPQQDPRPQHFRVMGLYNSGTNLLRELLLRNFPSEVDVHDPRYDGPDGIGPCMFWKHSSLAVLGKEHPSKLQGCGIENLTGIAIIRNPLSWLRSFKRVAYDLNHCKDRQDWVTRPCAFPKSVPEPSLALKEYPNVESIWTSWVKDYEDLPKFGFARSLVVRYEDVVLDTEGTLARIAALANLTLPKKTVEVEAAVHPTSKHRQGARARAIEKIKSKSYLKGFLPGSSLHQMCSLLDRDVMLRHGYTDCDDLRL